MYVTEKAELLFAGLETSDYPAFRGLETSDYPAFRGRYVQVDPQPVLGALGETGNGASTAIAVGAAGLVISAAVSFLLMVGATYLGCRLAARSPR